MRRTLLAIALAASLVGAGAATSQASSHKACTEHAPCYRIVRDEWGHNVRACYAVGYLYFAHKRGSYPVPCNSRAHW
jgi:uncharacterized membrane protein